VRRAPSLLFVTAAAVLVAAAIAAGFAVIGSPEQVRRERLDNQRVADLRRIATAITNYQRRHHALPPTLEELGRDGEVSLHLADAETGAPYGYRAESAAAYELCAAFDTARDERGEAERPWNHAAGRHCFRREVAAVGQ